MKNRSILLAFLTFLFLQPTYSQNPQLKMWSIPDYIYEFPTSVYTPTNSFHELLHDPALYYHNAMYMNNNTSTTLYQPKNQLWFYAVDNNIYYYNYLANNSTLICTLNSIYYPPPSEAMIHGEICIVPAPDHPNNPNQYYVITPGEFAKLNLCLTPNNIVYHEIGNLETIKKNDDTYYEEPIPPGTMAAD